MRPALTILRERPWYLWLVFAVPAITLFGHALAPGKPVFKAQDLGIIAALVSMVVVGMLWIPYRRHPRWPNVVLVFLGVVALAWLYQVVRIQIDQSLFNLTVVCVPLALIMIGLKPVSRRDADIALLVLAYSLLAISLLSLVLGRLGWMPDGFQVSDGGGERYPFLSWIGIPGRWGGPFESVNYASPVGGLLVVIGATRRGWIRWTLVGGGLLILALGQGRTALFATGAGLLVVVLWSPIVARSRQARAIRWTMLALAVVVVVAYTALLDPTFNGRTPIWSDFLGLLHANPVFGVGDSGIQDYMQARANTPGLVTHNHAHSVLLDGLVRFGIVMAIFTLAIYVLSLIAGVRMLRRGNAAPLAIAVFVIAAGTAETLHSWSYWTVYLASLTWVIIHCGAAEGSEAEDEADPDPSVSLSRAGSQ